MKYYSEKTKVLYNSAEECEKAELAAKEAENREKIRKEREAAQEKERKEKLSNERKARAAEVEDARKAMVEAQKKYRKVLEDFINDYHSYHLSTSSFDEIPTLFEFFNRVF